MIVCWVLLKIVEMREKRCCGAVLTQSILAHESSTELQTVTDHNMRQYGATSWIRRLAEAETSEGLQRLELTH